MGLLIDSNKLFPHEPQRELSLTLFKGLKKKVSLKGQLLTKTGGTIQAQKEAGL